MKKLLFIFCFLVVMVERPVYSMDHPQSERDVGRLRRHLLTVPTGQDVFCYTVGMAVAVSFWMYQIRHGDDSKKTGQFSVIMMIGLLDYAGDVADWWRARQGARARVT